MTEPLVAIGLPLAKLPENRPLCPRYALEASEMDREGGQ